jgi:hypothetical protein
MMGFLCQPILRDRDRTRRKAIALHRLSITKPNPNHFLPDSKAKIEGQKLKQGQENDSSTTPLQ